MENPQINPVNPQMPAEKSQAGTNLAIVILVLVIVVVGIKLLMSGTPANAPAAIDVVTSTESVAVTEEENALPNRETNAGESASVISTIMPGKGQVVFSVSAGKTVFVREIFVHNPYKIGREAWVQVYDGYKKVFVGNPTEIFTVSLATIAYDMVRVGFVDAATNMPDETVKNMPIVVSAQEKTMVQIDL